MSKILLIFSIISLTFCFFSSDTPVIQLDSKNFDKEITNSKDLALVLFYAPWCGHCKAFHPEFEKAAKALKGIFKICAIDADKEREIGNRFGVKGFPTVNFFGLDRKNPEKYSRARNAEAVKDFMFEKAKEIANQRLGGGAGSTGAKKEEKKATNTGSAGSNGANMEDGVYVLTDDNFDKMVFESKEMWLIAFYAPWCGHCKKLLPEWNGASAQLKGTIKVGKVDCTVQQKLASKYQIQGYPTIKIFSPGLGKDKQVEEWNGPRDQSGIVSFALDKLEKFGYVPETEQILGSKTFDSVIKDKVGIWVICFLPNIADSSAKERNRYLDIIKEANKKTRGKPIYYFWAQGGDFFDAEEKLHLSFGYPAVIAVNYKKKMYATMRSSFDATHLSDFIHGLLLGKEHLSKLPEGIKLKDVPKWDGKDYVPTKDL